MSRRDLELRAKKELEAEGWKVERAVSKAVFTPKGFAARSFDFFNCFDLIAVNNENVRFIQITSDDHNQTTNPNKSLNVHKRKIDRVWPYSQPEIWRYLKEGNRWKKEIHVRMEGEWVQIPSSESITGGYLKVSKSL